MGVLDLWGDWVWFAGAALGITTILASLVYMFAEILLNDKMKSWAKMELVEIFYSAVIISLAIVSLPIMDSVVQGSLMVSNLGLGGGTPGCLGPATSTYVPISDAGRFYVPVSGAGRFFGSQRYECLDICGGPIAANPGSVYHGIDSCHMRLGIWFLREVFDETKNLAYETYISYIESATISNFAINIEFVFEAAGFFTVTPWAGFYSVGNAIKSSVFDWSVKLMMLTKFQEVFLRFIATALFPALFVIGALLRTFVFTRRLGGLLLAMAITLYFIFPAFYALAALIMLDLKNDPVLHALWMADRDANPHQIPDPPVAKTMYFPRNMSVHTIGGTGSGAYTLDDATEALSRLEGTAPGDNMAAMEQCDNGILPSFDLSSDTYKSASDQEKNNVLTKAWEVAQNWFGAVSKVSKLDKFLDIAWRPNGAVDSAARLTFWSVFFSFISLIAAIAAIRSLSMTFGGDIEIAGLTRLI